MIDADLRLLRHVAEIVEREQIDVGRLLADLTALMRDHQLALPPDLALLFKAAISLEGLGRMLDPGFDMVSEALPFLQRIAMRAPFTARPRKNRNEKPVRESVIARRSCLGGRLISSAT